MAKSKRNNSVVLHGFLDVDNGTITEVVEKKNQEPQEFTFPYDQIIKQFNGKEVVISIRETEELESEK